MSDLPRQPEADDPVLTFEHVSLESAPGYDTSLQEVSFTLNPGDLLLVRLEWEMLNIPLADLASGILEPDEGTVKFKGQDWTRMGFTHATRERGRIGRTFEGTGWVGNLDVDENVYLAERHHTRRSSSDIASEAAALVGRFGLGSVPSTRPAQTPRADLSRAALVRAFLSSPKLLILERPTTGIYPEIMPALLAELKLVRQKGSGVLWLTNRSEIWEDPSLLPTQRYVMEGDRLVPA